MARSCTLQINSPPRQRDGIFTTTFRNFLTACSPARTPFTPSGVPPACRRGGGVASCSVRRAQSKYFHPHILKMSGPIYSLSEANGAALPSSPVLLGIQIVLFFHGRVGTRGGCCGGDVPLTLVLAGVASNEGRTLPCLLMPNEDSSRTAGAINEVLESLSCSQAYRQCSPFIR